MVFLSLSIDKTIDKICRKLTAFKIFIITNWISKKSDSIFSDNQKY